MCGLFGFVGKEKANPAKIIMLGKYNIFRGRDSCGIYPGALPVRVGVDKLKEFDDFISVEGTDVFKTYRNAKTNTIIGHTRKATFGLHTKENAHPFEIIKGYGKSWNKKLMVGAHNGVIDNQDTIIVDHPVMNTDHWDKNIDLDSKAILTLVANALDDLNLMKEILEGYQGAAALLFSPLDDPDTLYFYKGASKEYNYGKVQEERPLFCLDTSEGTYLSSMKESLDIINYEGNVVLDLVPNRLYKQKGDKREILLEVDRANNFRRNYNNGLRVVGPSQNNTPQGQQGTLPLTNNNKSLHELEKQFIQNTGNFLYYQSGHYYRNGHIFNKFVSIAKQTDDLLKTIDRFAVEIDIETGEILTGNREGVLVYIIDGYLFEEVDGALTYLESILSYKTLNHKDISYLVNHPVPSRTPASGWAFFFYKGKIATGDFSPLFSHCSYKFENGQWKGVSKLKTAANLVDKETEDFKMFEAKMIELQEALGQSLREHSPINFSVEEKYFRSFYSRIFELMKNVNSQETREKTLLLEYTQGILDTIEDAG